MGGALRILQVGKLSLDEPFQGFIPARSESVQNQKSHDRLLKKISDFKYQAARNLFASAITEQADLVLLAGKLCTDENDPRPFWFLQEQFEQLRKHQIEAVCVDTTNHFCWPKTVSLPENVRVIDRNESLEFQVRRNSQSIWITWNSHREDVVRPQDNKIEIRLDEKAGCVTAVSYRPASKSRFERIPVHDLQASSFSEAGPHQATLVEVDGLRGVSSSPVLTESIACETLKVEIQPSETLSQLSDRLAEELRQLERRQNRTSVPTLLRIELSVSPKRLAFSLDFSRQRELLSTLQDHASRNGSRVWPCRIEIDPNGSDQRNLGAALPIQVAFNELAELTLRDVNAPLDAHSLKMNQQTFQRQKSQVALRIPNILAE